MAGRATKRRRPPSSSNSRAPPTHRVRRRYPRDSAEVLAIPARFPARLFAKRPRCGDLLRTSRLADEGARAQASKRCNVAASLSMSMGFTR